MSVPNFSFLACLKVARLVSSAAKRDILLKCSKCVLNVYHFSHEMCTFCVPICLHFRLNVDFHTNEAKMIKLRN